MNKKEKRKFIYKILEKENKKTIDIIEQLLSDNNINKIKKII